MDTQNSQKKSRHSSAKSERNRAEQSYRPVPDFDDEEYMDRSIDHVARVRAAKEAAQREMESFGDVSEYDVTTIQGCLKEPPAVGSQSTIDFPGDKLHEPQETQ